MTKHRNTFSIALFILLFVLVSGTALIMQFEGLGLIDAMFYTLLIITTVGAKHEPTTIAGKITTAYLLFFGLGLVLYIATTFARYLIEGEIRRTVKAFTGGFNKMKSLRGHFIVCGYGRTGKYVVETLKERKEKVFIIEKDREICQNLANQKDQFINGNAVDPEILKQANIKTAKGLIACLEDDADNLYLLMSASELNEGLTMAARAHEIDAVPRLRKMGASVVIQPQVTGGKQLVTSLMEKIELDKDKK